MNPHKLHFTDASNPDPKPVQAISVTFEGVGETNTYIDPVTGNAIPAVPRLTEQESIDREAKIAASSRPWSDISVGFNYSSVRVPKLNQQLVG